MMMNSVTIPPRVLAGLRRQAVSAADAECCGALIGDVRGTVVEVRCLIPVENAAASPLRYRIDADEVLRLERQAKCAGRHVVGFYHSHPAGAAVPSAVDLELAVPGYIHVIIETASGVVRAWRLRDDRTAFRELAVNALEGAA